MKKLYSSKILLETANKIKFLFHSQSRGVTPKHVTSGGVHLRGLAPISAVAAQLWAPLKNPFKGPYTKLSI